jgi:hypothetical protein
MNRRVQAYQRYPDLERIQTRWSTEFVSRPDQAGAFSKSCDGDDQELFHAGAVSPKGCDDA